MCKYNVEFFWKICFLFWPPSWLFWLPGCLPCWRLCPVRSLHFHNFLCGETKRLNFPANTCISWGLFLFTLLWVLMGSLEKVTKLNILKFLKTIIGSFSNIGFLCVQQKLKMAHFLCATKVSTDFWKQLNVCNVRCTHVANVHILRLSGLMEDKNLKPRTTPNTHQFDSTHNRKRLRFYRKGNVYLTNLTACEIWEPQVYVRNCKR